MKSTEDLIQGLSRNIDPVKRLSNWKLRFTKSLMVIFLCLGAALLIKGLRPDLGQALGSPRFIVEVLITLLLALSSVCAAFILSVPGEERSPATKYVPLITGFSWLFLLGGKIIYAFSTPNLTLDLYAGTGLSCVGDITLFALAPALILLWMIKHAYPLDLGWSGLLIILGAASFAAFGINFTCKNDSALHILVWHFSPVVVVGFLGNFIGRWLLKR